MKNELLTQTGGKLVKSFHKTKFWAKRKSPELLIAGSIVAGAASIVLAVKATLKIEETMKDSNERIQEIKDKMDDANSIANNEYSLEEGKKELTRAYFSAGWKLTKLYGPTALAFTASVASLFGSHKVMKGRMAGLAAAYTTIDKAFDSYRARVRDKIGEKAELDVYQNNYKESREVTVEGKDGKKKEAKRKVKQPHIDEDSDFVWVFDAAHPEWTRHGKLNLEWLMHAERYLNEKLRAQGHLFLWDVYRELGVEPRDLGPRKLQAARVLGWIYDPEDTTRDNYISFGISDEMGNLTEHAMEAVRGQSKDIFIEFNPDGDILTGSDDQKIFVNYTNVIN
jgi:hypothetical protein